MFFQTEESRNAFYQDVTGEFQLLILVIAVTLHNKEVGCHKKVVLSVSSCPDAGIRIAWKSFSFWPYIRDSALMAEVSSRQRMLARYDAVPDCPILQVVNTFRWAALPLVRRLGSYRFYANVFDRNLQGCSETPKKPVLSRAIMGRLLLLQNDFDYSYLL